MLSQRVKAGQYQEAVTPYFRIVGSKEPESQRPVCVFTDYMVSTSCAEARGTEHVKVPSV